jgi:hypothetical protein
MGELLLLWNRQQGVADRRVAEIVVDDAPKLLPEFHASTCALDAGSARILTPAASLERRGRCKARTSRREVSVSCADANS